VHVIVAMAGSIVHMVTLQFALVRLPRTRIPLTAWSTLGQYPRSAAQIL
jgi:hypothetical protein